MNERGKSDSPVVPAKPPNKTVGRGGGGGKGAGQGEHGRQNASRTQSRIRRVTVRWIVCVKWHEGIRKHGSRRCCTMSTVGTSAGGVLGDQPEGRSGGGRGDVGGLRAGPGGESPGPARTAAHGALPGEAHHGGRTSRRRTGGSDRSASPRWRTRSFSGPSSRCSTPSMRWTSGASRMGSGRDAARMMRWMPSRSGSSGSG